MSIRIFDCHSHWGTEKGYIFRTPEERSQQEKVWKTKTEFFTEDEMAGYFRASNAEVILDFAFTRSLPIAEMREYHDYAFQVQRKHPDVIFGHWLQLDPRNATDALPEFRRALDEKAGFVGLAVSGQSVGIPASEPVWDPFYRLAIESRTPVMILVGLTGIGQGLPGGNGILLDHGHPRHVDAVAARYPELRILAARPAWPWQDDMIAVLLHKANVDYELHGWSPKYYTAALKREIRDRLQDRIMFGCDFPVLRYEKVVGAWQAEDYSEAVLEKVLYSNAARYFGHQS